MPTKNKPSKSLNKFNDPSSKDNSFNKAFFLKIVESKPSIKIEKVEKEGDVAFSLTQEAIGLEEGDIKINPIIKTNFFSNFVGELLVRQNLNDFVKLLVKIDPIKYHNVVCGFNHKNFGMVVDSKRKVIIFKFHLSLIQDILLEDINNMITVSK